jgi:hypothetical protein
MADFMVGGIEEFEQTPEQMALVAEMTAAAVDAVEKRKPV